MPENPSRGAETVKSLIESFRTRARDLHAESTTEAQIRLELLDPIWEALGWDVRNAAGRSDAEKDVLIDARVGTIEAGHTRSRRSDYLLRIDGFPGLFVEAEKPAVNLALDTEAIFHAPKGHYNRAGCGAA